MQFATYKQLTVRARLSHSRKDAETTKLLPCLFCIFFDGFKGNKDGAFNLEPNKGRRLHVYENRAAERHVKLEAGWGGPERSQKEKKQPNVRIQLMASARQDRNSGCGGGRH